MNKKVVETISHNEYKDLLLNKKCIRHSMNRIQSMNIKQEHMKQTKFHGLILMIKCIFKTIEKTD